LKPLNSTLALGFCSRVLTEGRAKWLFYVHLSASVLHTIAAHLHGWLGRKHRHQETPPVCRPALVKRLVKHLVQRWNKAKCISELTRHAHLGRFVFKSIGVNNEYHNAWRRSDRNPSIHPWRTYV